MVFIDLGKRRTDLACCLADVGGIDASPVERRPDRDESDLAVTDRRAQVRGCAQPVSDMSLQQLVEAGLEDRTLASLESFNSLLVHVYAGNLMAKLRETGSAHEADIAGANNANSHQASSASRL